MALAMRRSSRCGIRAHYDGLGQLRLSRQLDGGTIENCNSTSEAEPAEIKVKRGYRWEAGGHYEVVSNPYVNIGESTMGWTLTRFDDAGRASTVESYAGDELPVAFNGSNNTITGRTSYSYDVATTIDGVGRKSVVTDPMGAARESHTDAAGRLIKVVEAPGVLNYATYYRYDGQDSLLGVCQGAAFLEMTCPATAQSRSYEYSSLKRLVSATNPESGTQSYHYDGNGNLTSRTDARNVTTTMYYDALNRAVRKSYSDGSTPAVIWCYDGDTVNHTSAPVRDCSTAPANADGTNLKGRVSMVSNPASATRFLQYDGLGRPISQTQTTGAQYGFTYEYYPLGLKMVTYPSGRKVKASLDGVGRPSAVEDWTGGSLQKAYVSGVSYAPQGAPAQITMGAALTDNRTYNSRLQPVTLELRRSATFRDEPGARVHVDGRVQRGPGKLQQWQRGEPVDDARDSGDDAELHV